MSQKEDNQLNLKKNPYIIKINLKRTWGLENYTCECMYMHWNKERNKVATFHILLI